MADPKAEWSGFLELLRDTPVPDDFLSPAERNAPGKAVRDPLQNDANNEKPPEAT